PVVAHNTCGASEYWNGAACSYYSGNCPIGQNWNGTQCTQSANRCGTITARMAAIANELRAAKADVRIACANGPSTPECIDAQMREREVETRYRMLMNEAPLECRG